MSAWRNPYIWVFCVLVGVPFLAACYYSPLFADWFRRPAPALNTRAR